MGDDLSAHKSSLARAAIAVTPLIICMLMIGRDTFAEAGHPFRQWMTVGVHHRSRPRPYPMRRGRWLCAFYFASDEFT